MNTFNYPEEPNSLHQEVVTKLLRGVFISIGEKQYDFLQKHKEWYSSFFVKNFSIGLNHEEEVFYCVMPHGGYKNTSEILTVVAILLYELNKKDIDPVAAIHNEEFSLGLIGKYITESVQFAEFMSVEKLVRIINKMETYGLIRKTNNDKFVFRHAIDVFLKEYNFLAEQVSSLEN